METLPVSGDQDSLLASVEPTVRAAIAQASEAVVLAVDSRFASAGEPTTDLYFIETGFVSVMVGQPDGSGVEVGLIGREGLVGSWLAMGCATAPFDVVVRSPVQALRLPAHDFQDLGAAYPDLQAAALAHCNRFMHAVAETCQAQAKLTVEGRLARWLLLARDRMENDLILITHETLSKILGVRRPGVTVAMHVLEGEHIVKASRGMIRIVDAEKLALAATRQHQPRVEITRTAAAASVFA